MYCPLTCWKSTCLIQVFYLTWAWRSINKRRHALNPIGHFSPYSQLIKKQSFNKRCICVRLSASLKWKWITQHNDHNFHKNQVHVTLLLSNLSCLMSQSFYITMSREEICFDFLFEMEDCKLVWSQWLYNMGNEKWTMIIILNVTSLWRCVLFRLWTGKNSATRVKSKFKSDYEGMSSEYAYESKSYDMSCTTIWQLLNTHLIVLYSLGFILISIELVNRYLMQCNTIVRVVRTIRRLFGSDSSKRTKFAPEIDNAIGFTFLPGAKLSDIYTNKEFIKF